MRFIAPLAILSSSAATSTGGGITPEDGRRVEADKAAHQPEGSASASAGENKGAWGSVDNPPPTPKESEVDKRIRGSGGLLENMKKEARSGEGKTVSRELQMELARYLSDGGVYSSFNRAELERMEPSSGALRRQFYEMGGHGKFPMMRPQFLLYEIVNGINHFAQMLPGEQTTNMRMLRHLEEDYARVKEAQGIAGLDRAEFDAAGQTLAQLQAQYSRSLK